LQEQIHQDIIVKYLDAPEDASLLTSVNEFRSRSAENENYFQEIKSIWEASAKTGFLAGIDHKSSIYAFQSKLTDGAPEANNFGFLWLRNIAAALVVALLAFWIYSKQTQIDYLVKQTGNSIDSVLLSDGTKVILAAHTVIKFPKEFKSKVREISLVKGQAFFKVHHDPDHPFNVAINNSKVTVLGTSFNIEYSLTEINVAVETGRVMFSPNIKSEPAILNAGQAISYNYVQSNLTLQEAINAKSWLTKDLQFVDMPLDEVCKQLSDYYKIQVILHDKKNTAKKFNAHFTNSSLEEVLTVLKETYKIEIVNQDSVLTINIK
jgi:transmembrane sensor